MQPIWVCPGLVLDTHSSRDVWCKGAGSWRGVLELLEGLEAQAIPFEGTASWSVPFSPAKLSAPECSVVVVGG
jgi:hypothetical protein